MRHSTDQLWTTSRHPAGIQAPQHKTAHFLARKGETRRVWSNQTTWEIRITVFKIMHLLDKEYLLNVRTTTENPGANPTQKIQDGYFLAKEWTLCQKLAAQLRKLVSISFGAGRSFSWYHINDFFYEIMAFIRLFGTTYLKTIHRQKKVSLVH